jgi:cation diffusion facilitator family transporter
VLSNAGLAAMKLAVGYFAGSRAVLADGVHSLSDVVMNLGAWLGWRYASKPRDADHHYGHGNGEAVTTLVVGLIVIAAGAALVWTALRGHSTVTFDALGLAAVATELVSVVVKIGLTWVTRKRGREFDSSILIALSRDNAGDVLSSALIMIAVLGTILGQRWLEPLAAMMIGLVITWQGIQSVREGMGVLMDRAPDPELVDLLREAALAVPGVRRVDDVRIHPLGTHLRVDLEIAVDGNLAVREGHDIAHRVERALVDAHKRVEEVAVHVNPSE